MRVATEAPVDFATGVTNAVLSAATFIVVLWTIGGSLTVTVAGVADHHSRVPGDCRCDLCRFWRAGRWCSSAAAFVTVSENKSQAEAEYRYVLTRLRENGESIAVLGGENEERSAIDHSLATVLRRWREICVQTMRTTVVSQTSGICRVGLAYHPVCTEVSRWFDDARAGHASGRPPLPSCNTHSIGWSTTIRDFPTGRPPPLACLPSWFLLTLWSAPKKASAGSSAARQRMRRYGSDISRSRSRTAPQSSRTPRSSSHAANGFSLRGVRHREEHAGARHCRFVALGRRLYPSRSRR